MASVKQANMNELHQTSSRSRMPNSKGDLERGYTRESLVGERYETDSGRVEYGKIPHDVEGSGDHFIY